MAERGSLEGKRFDAAVIGAGFGGLGAAVELARQGFSVVLCESLKYAGGCASTFRRAGYAFEAGATLFSGLAEDQLLGRWIRELSLPVEIEWLDPVVTLSAPGISLGVPSARDGLLDALSASPGAPRAKLVAFFEEQRRVAAILWRLFDDPTLLPPFDASALRKHLARSPAYLGLVPLLGRTLASVVERHGLSDFLPLSVYLDALCQITVQCSAREAEASFALAAMDYYYRGTGHVQGGIGVLASALASAVGALGGQVSLANRVHGVRALPDGFTVASRRGTFHASQLVANVLPQAALSLLAMSARDLPHVDRLARRVSEGWGAAMLYLVAEPPAGLGPAASHLQLIGDVSAPLVEGNHVFVSIGGRDEAGRAPPGYRVITASTHVSIGALRELDDRLRAERVGEIQARMRATLAARGPAWLSEPLFAETASPRTFERFTGRPEGLVGGVPRRAGLSHYRDLGPFEVVPGMYLVGDSVFPGQSTYATAVGGARVAERVARTLRCARVA